MARLVGIGPSYLLFQSQLMRRSPALNQPTPCGSYHRAANVTSLYSPQSLYARAYNGDRAIEKSVHKFAYWMGFRT